MKSAQFIRLLLAVLFITAFSHNTSLATEPISRESFFLSHKISEDTSRTLETRAKAYFSQLIPLGTDIKTVEELLKAEKVESVDVDPRNGIILPSGVAEKRGIKGAIGTQSIRVIVEKLESHDVPLVQYLFVHFGFDAQGKLIAIEPSFALDGV